MVGVYFESGETPLPAILDDPAGTSFSCILCRSTLHLPFPLYSQKMHMRPLLSDITFPTNTPCVIEMYLLSCMLAVYSTGTFILLRQHFLTGHYACIKISVVQQKVNVYIVSCSLHVLIDKSLFLLSKIDTIIIVPMNDCYHSGAKFSTILHKIVDTTKRLLLLGIHKYP